MTQQSTGKGPLAGLTVIEFAGIGPGPFAAMLFADMGATVVRIERKSAVRRPLSLLSLGRFDVTSRGKLSVGLDIKRLEGRNAALR
ncbi:MAG: CoA transferase, partial [Caldilinea sp.]